MSNLVINIEAHTLGPVSIVAPPAEGSKVTGHPTMPRGDSETAYIPASTLRGRLRRGVVMPMAKADADAGKPWRLPRIYALLIGQDTESEKKAETVDLKAIAAQRLAEPVLDLFGVGLTLAGRLVVSHLLPVENVAPIIITGTRRDLDDDESLVEMMTPEDRAAFEGRGAANTQRVSHASSVKALESKRRAAIKKDAKADTSELDTAIEVAKVAEAAAEAAMGEMKNSTRTLIQHSAMPAGVDLRGRIVVRNEREGDLEMLLGAFDELSRMPILGGHSARGCGEVSMVLKILRDGEPVMTAEVGGFVGLRRHYARTAQAATAGEGAAA
jgi:CRISPR type IV-associated protein Csf2